MCLIIQIIVMNYHDFNYLFLYKNKIYNERLNINWIFFFLFWMNLTCNSFYYRILFIILLEHSSIFFFPISEYPLFLRYKGILRIEKKIWSFFSNFISKIIFPKIKLSENFLIHSIFFFLNDISFLSIQLKFLIKFLYV